MKKLIKAFSIIVFNIFYTGSLFATNYTVGTGAECDCPTIQGVFDKYDLKSGDIIEVRADTPGGTIVYRESIQWGKDDLGSAKINGDSSSNYVILRGRKGDNIVVSGFVECENFKRGNNGWYTTKSIRQVFSVTEDRAKILQRGNYLEKPKSGQWDWNAGVLFYSPSSGSVEEHRIEASVQKYCIQILKKYSFKKECFIQIENLSVRGGGYDGIIINGNNIVIKNCLAYLNGGGVHGGVGIRVGEKNKFLKDVKILNCNVYKNFIDGCYFDSINNFVFSGNKVENNNLSRSVGDAIQLFQVNNFIIEYNSFQNIMAKAKGVVTIVNSYDGIFRHNFLDESNFGLGVGGTSKRIDVAYNVVCNQRQNAFQLTGSEMVLSYNITVGNGRGLYLKDASQIVVNNNSFLKNKYRGVEIKGVSQCNFFNNVVYSDSCEHLLMVWPESKFNSDYNYYGYSSKYMKADPWILKNSKFKYFFEYKKAVSPNEIHSYLGGFPYQSYLNTDAVLVRKGKLDVRDNSKIIDSGKDNIISKDIYDTKLPQNGKYDIGAVEKNLIVPN